MKTALFLCAWTIAYAINPAAVSHKGLFFAAIIVALAITDLAGWAKSVSK